MLHLVTGYKGSAHVTSADQGAFNAALIGSGDYVCQTGKMFEAQIVSNNSIRIFDGDLLMQGRHVNLKFDTYEDVTIENGVQDVNRNDLIVCRYAKDASSGKEAAILQVVKGTATTGTASDPAVTTGDILGGAILHEMPLYRVKIEGLSIVAIQKLFNTVSPVVEVVSQADLEAYAISKSGVLSGTLSSGGWSASAPYTQTLKISNIKSSDVPVISCGNPTTLSADNYKALGKAYSFIDRAVTNNGSITFYCYRKKPTVDVPLFIKI